MGLKAGAIFGRPDRLAVSGAVAPVFALAELRCGRQLWGVRPNRAPMKPIYAILLTGLLAMSFFFGFRIGSVGISFGWFIVLATGIWAGG